MRSIGRAFIHVLVTTDVFHHHDGVINQQPYAKGQATQGHDVQAKPG